jgi:hypothetical protein
VFRLNILCSIHFILYGINNGFFLLIFIFAILTIIVVLRIRKVIQGTKVDVKKTIIFSVYFVAVAAFLVFNSFLIGGVQFVFLVPYFVVALAALYCSYRYSKRALSFSEIPTDNDGSNSTIIYAKGGLSIYILYVIALSVRIVINLLFIGSEKLYFNSQLPLNDTGAATLIMQPLVGTNSTTMMLAFIATDILLIGGSGLVVGRNVRIMKYYYSQVRKK